jgi:hypothetical protein
MHTEQVIRERNYLRRQVLNQSRQMDDLMDRVNEQAAVAAFIESSVKSSRSLDGSREATDLNPRRIPAPTTTPRLRKPKGKSRTPTRS